MIIERVDVPAAMLGESPLWCPHSHRLFWIDGLAGHVLAYQPGTGSYQRWETGDRIGSIGLGAGNALLVALPHHLFRLDLDSGALILVAPVGHDDPNLRLNDGKMDRRGCFVCGEMALDGKPDGALYRFGAEGSVETIESGVRIANGVCFSPAGDRMYFADSLKRRIDVYDYDTSSGALGAPRTLIDLAPLGTMPDGATVDRDGNIWIALTATGEIGCVSPVGELIERIAMPIEFPTCPAFGGEQLDTLYVATIKDSGTGRAVSRHPDGGGLFAIRGLDARGIAETRFAPAISETAS